MFNALVIGCGNIGAGYDFANDQVLTHSKAYSQNPHFTFSVFDTDQNLAQKVSEKYNCGVVHDLKPETLTTFDCVSICSPTGTHFEYLKMALNAGVKVIACEKPVAYKAGELDALEKMYHAHASKILVNYTRRFQPAYITLKETISELMLREKLTNISIRYQRGFLNNCSHALDLIQFLTEKEFQLTNTAISNRIKDHFENDPTLSLTGLWGATNVSILGLSDVKFSLFEIELYFEHTRISLLNSGDTIRLQRAENADKFLQPLQTNEKEEKQGCLKNTMINVIDRVHELLVSEQTRDNFVSALRLNQYILKIIEN
jgi:predicted dehydrogenase